MKHPKLPESASEDARALALAKRIGVSLFCRPPPPLSSGQRTELYAAIGRKYAETQQEFRRGSRRELGSKNIKPRAKPPVDPKGNDRLRRYRNRKVQATKARRRERLLERYTEHDIEAGLIPPWEK
jgi:hypothetical protein